MNDLMTNSPLRKGLLLLTVLAMTVSAYLLFHHGTETKATSASGERILLVSPEDETNPALSKAIVDLESSGFTILDNPVTALQLGQSDSVVAFFVTRGAFAKVPSTAWRAMYQRNVIVGGLDVGLDELLPLAIPGSAAGTARVKFNVDRPIFSLLYSLGGCGRGATSDWLDRWPHLSGLIQQRALEIATAKSRGLPDADCAADQHAGGAR